MVNFALREYALNFTLRTTYVKRAPVEKNLSSAFLRNAVLENKNQSSTFRQRFFEIRRSNAQKCRVKCNMGRLFSIN